MVKLLHGTEGSFDIVIDTTGAEVGVKYDITFKLNGSNTKLPTNLVFKLDGDSWNYADGITGTIDANAESKTVTHTITWSWPYNTTNGDATDTTDGINAFDYSFTVNAIGTQVKPAVASN